MASEIEKSALDLELEALDAQILIATIETPEQEEARKRQAIKDKKALLQAIQKHGKIGEKIHSCDTGKGIVIVKKPRLSVWRTEALNPDVNKKYDTIVFDSLVYPQLDEYRKLESEFPQLPANLYALCSWLAGFGQETTLSK
jgi:hypothetical protein